MDASKAPSFNGHGWTEKQLYEELQKAKRANPQNLENQHQLMKSSNLQTQQDDQLDNFLRDIVATATPFSAADKEKLGKHFQKKCQMSRQQLAAQILTLKKNTLERIKAEYKGGQRAATAICCLDGWKPPYRPHLYGLWLQTSQVSLGKQHKFFFKFCESPPEVSQDSLWLAQQLRAAYNELKNDYNIVIVAFACDNAAVNNAAMMLLRNIDESGVVGQNIPEKYKIYHDFQNEQHRTMINKILEVPIPWYKGMPLIHVHCFCHSVDLAIREFCKEYELSQIIKYYNESSEMAFHHTPETRWTYFFVELNKLPAELKQMYKQEIDVLSITHQLMMKTQQKGISPSNVNYYFDQAIEQLAMLKETVETKKGRVVKTTDAAQLMINLLEYRSDKHLQSTKAIAHIHEYLQKTHLDSDEIINEIKFDCEILGIAPFYAQDIDRAKATRRCLFKDFHLKRPELAECQLLSFYYDGIYGISNFLEVYSCLTGTSVDVERLFKFCSFYCGGPERNQLSTEQLEAACVIHFDPLQQQPKEEDNQLALQIDL